MKNYLKLLHFLKGHRRLFGLAILTMFVASLLEGFQLPMVVALIDRVFVNGEIIIPNNLPSFIENLVSYLNAMERQRLFYFFLAVAFCAMLAKNVFVFVYQYLMSDVSQSVIRDIRDQLYEKMQNLSLDYFSKRRTGELVSRITFDVNAIENAVSYALIDLFRQSFMIMIYITIAFSIYPKAALVIFIIFPLIAYPMSKIGKRLKKLSVGKQEKMADMNTLLLETISGVKIVKAFNTEGYETKRFKDRNREFYKLMMKSVKRMIVISPLTEIFGGICAFVIIFWLGRLIMEGELSTGIFVLFMGSIMSLISPVKKISNANALIQTGLAAGERIYSVLESPVTVKEKPDPIELEEMKDSIVFEDVSFHYSEETTGVLQDINLEIKKGELVAIVGPTGGGKTTMANLIPRFYDPISGSLKMDGQDLRDVSFRSLRGQIGIVMQESILFNDTVRANIAYGQSHASLEQVKDVAKKAFAHDFIENMPQGYDTLIGDRGFRLSGGEKQRISIARAILKNPPILILDEATSQLDSESEKYVQEALDELMRGRTVVAIAHRLSTIKRADKIVVLERGRIVGLGRHEELLKTCPLYNKLHSMQFQTK